MLLMGDETTDSDRSPRESRKVQLSESHPLHGKEDLLDTHAGHIEAFTEVLENADPDEVNALMIIMATDTATDTLPTITPDANADMYNWVLLATHLNYVANAYGSSPEETAQHAVHVLLNKLGVDPQHPR